MDHTLSFDNQMIKLYPIIKPTKILLNLIVPGVEPPLSLYTHEAAEDNARCFQELKRIVQGTEAKVSLMSSMFTQSSVLLGGSCIILSLVLGQKIRLLPNWRKQFKISGTVGQSMGLTYYLR